MDFVNDKELDRLNFNLAIIGNTDKEQNPAKDSEDSRGVYQKMIIANYSKIIKKLYSKIPDYMVNLYKSQFGGYVQGKTLSGKQVEVISNYYQNDQVAKDIKGLQNFPRLMQVIKNY